MTNAYCHNALLLKQTKLKLISFHCSDIESQKIGKDVNLRHSADILNLNDKYFTTKSLNWPSITLISHMRFYEYISTMLLKTRNLFKKNRHHKSLRIKLTEE